ncbi:MAG: 6-pyruvoyl trahydropterin synthase family protein [Phycisphaerales bacterium JB061]
MVELRRTVRANLGGGFAESLPSGANGHGGQPAMSGLGTYYEFEIACSGIPDENTGYLVNIKQIDQAVRGTVLPRVHEQLLRDASVEPTGLLLTLAESLKPELPTDLVSIRWNLSPTYSLEYRMASPNSVLLRQRFEFAAAHRLNVSSLSDDQNRDIFGKCNNPSGHGHNYELEVCCRMDLNADPFTVAMLESIVDRVVIQRFDHKHLNLDTEEFASETGLNPSVENIAKVCFDLLSPAVAEGSGNPKLEHVTVWETPKTSCTYPG